MAKAAAAAEARRKAAQKQPEEERRATEEARSARPASDGREHATEAESALAGEFVDIPGGSFQMGCSPGDSECDSDEGPVHTVSIKPFRMGKYEVTVGQFRRFVEAAGYRTDAARGGNCFNVRRDRVWVEELESGTDWRNPGFQQQDRHPVVCVSWNDARAYAQWLSRQGGGRYRLPSESEWEYAARAGGRGPYSFATVRHFVNTAMSLTIPSSTNLTNVHRAMMGHFNTAPVLGGYRPNGFGLHDMHGNVWEWTEDCYHDSYADAPSDGVAWTAGDCARRVHRGGSWFSVPRNVRSSSRDGFATDNRGAALAFASSGTDSPLDATLLPFAFSRPAVAARL